MNRIFGTLLLAGFLMPASAQRLLTLDSCRQMALRNNKQLSISKLKQAVAAELRKSARTKLLPHVSAMGTYEHTSRPISLLSDQQKGLLPKIGTGVVGSMQPQMAGIETSMQQIGTAFVKMGVPAAEVQQMMGGLQTQLTDGVTSLATQLNNVGAEIVDAEHGQIRLRRNARIDQRHDHQHHHHPCYHHC